MTASKADKSDTVVVGGTRVPRGRRRRISMPVARLPTANWMSLEVEVVHGREPGPRIWLNAAIHGDELNGIEIIQQILETVDPKKLRGTILAVPIVNVFGFINQERYLPDRRDLNRSFPGSAKGSLASRLAHLFMTEIVAHCSHGIDLHTGSNHRTNLPQVRADLEDPDTRAWAEAFGAPVMLHARSRSGSLREAAARIGKTVLLYEGGEPLRFDREAIRSGVDGVRRAMATLGMISDPPAARAGSSGQVSRSSWVRARRSGILRVQAGLGERVQERQVLAIIHDVFGRRGASVRAPFDGIVIGHTHNPLAHQGDALFHVAQVDGGQAGTER